MSSATVKPNPGGDKLRFDVLSNPVNGKSSAQKWYIKVSHPAEASRWVHAIQRSIEWTKSQAKAKEAAELGSLKSSRHTKQRSVDALSTSSSQGGHHGITDGEEKVGSSESSFIDSEKENTPPHSDSYDIHANTLVAQLDLTSQLLDSLALPPMPSPRVLETRKAIKDSLSLLQTSIHQYTAMSREREEWWKEKLDKERDRAAVWEESLNVVVREGEVLERELRNTLRAPKVPKKRVTGVWEEGGIQSMAASLTVPAPIADTAGLSASTTRVDIAAAAPVVETRAKAVAIDIPKGPISVAVLSPELDDTEEEDEFFDAIESGTLPMEISKTLVSAPVPSAKDVHFVDVSKYAAYTRLRDKLPLGADERPAISLWSVLRNNIGKDLTRISFPVTFNEPTSMLQRMVRELSSRENCHGILMEFLG